MVIGGQGCSHILVIFLMAERTSLSSYLVILYWLGGLVFALRIFEFNKVT
jgi:hypothetical protein